MRQSPDVSICECFARDGLQHEAKIIPAHQKIELLNRLSKLGFDRVEASSYSNPKVIPQFADVSEVMAGMDRQVGVSYKATCANPRAVERAIGDLQAGYGATEISMLVSASESHSDRNLKRSRAAQWENIDEMLALAKTKFKVIGTISVAFGCPFEGHVDPKAVLKDVETFAVKGVRFVNIADTTGLATPRSVRTMVRQVLSDFPDVTPIMHFHDTRGTALVNCVAALEAGGAHFDSAIGGVGGHPAGVRYGGGYTGNVCTEDLVNLFESMGVATGIHLDGLMEVAHYCESLLERRLNSRTVVSGYHSALTKKITL